MFYSRAICAAFVCSTLVFPHAVFGASQQDQADGAPKYKLTILEDASKTKRGKKGRVSSDTVVKITDQNNVPVSGIAVAFAITKASGGVAFSSGGMSALVTTNAAGIASSGSFAAATTSTFTMSVTASVPGAALSAAVPVTGSALAASAGIGIGAGAAGGVAGGAAAGVGVSTGVIAGIVAGVAAVAVGVVAGVASGGGDKPVQPPAGPRAAIAAGSGGVNFFRP